jgi:hypothetical protein
MTLREYLAACRAKPFAAGSHDCAQFVAGWIEASTGRDLRPWRYRSLYAGRKRLAREGHADLASLAAAHLAEVPRLRALPGDVAIVEGQFGIVAGEVIAVLREHGMGWVPLTAAQRVFRP